MTSTPAPLSLLIDRLAGFFFLARQYGQALHATDALSSGERAILKEIAAAGSRTVPDLAESRAISRQAIQKTVDLLVARGALTKAASTRDRRTRRLGVTPAGTALLRKIARREADEAARFRTAFTAQELETFTTVLGRLETILAQRTEELSE